MLINARDLDSSPPEWLVDKMIPRVGTGFWYGPRWTGKSLAVDVELALAVGNEDAKFFGRETVHGTVVIALGEGVYDAGIRKTARLAREQDDRTMIAAQIAVEHGDDVAKAYIDQLPLYTDEKINYHVGMPFTLPITRADGEGEMTRSLRAFINKCLKYDDLELVILDAVSDFTGGLSISNDASANRLMLGLKALADELNCFVLCVAHPTEKGDKMLGAGRLGNAADWIARQQSDGKDDDGNPASTVTCEKNKYGGPFDPFSFIVVPCEWQQPELDYQDLPTGEMITVTSATVRALDDDSYDDDGNFSSRRSRRSRRQQPLPKLSDITNNGRTRKRSGILRSMEARYARRFPQ